MCSLLRCWIGTQAADWGTWCIPVHIMWLCIMVLGITFNTQSLIHSLTVVQHCYQYSLDWIYLYTRRLTPANRYYRKTSNISRTSVGNKIVDHSDVVGASPVGAAPTTSSFSTWHLASRDSAKKAARQYENLLSVVIWCVLYQRLDGKYYLSMLYHSRSGFTDQHSICLITITITISQISVSLNLMT